MTATCFGFLPKATFRLCLRGFSDLQLTMFSNTRCPLHELLQYAIIFLVKYYSVYVVGSKIFRPDIQKPHQMENAVRDI